MKALGMILLGLGIVILLPGIAIIFEEINTLGRMFLAFAGVGAISIPMIAGGLTLIRRAEYQHRVKAARKGSRDEADEWDDEQLTTFEQTRERIASFDLTRLNWIGWSLFLGTFAFIGILLVLVMRLLPDKAEREEMPQRIIALSILVLAVGFFFTVRFILAGLGISIAREATPKRSTKRRKSRKER